MRTGRRPSARPGPTSRALRSGPASALPSAPPLARTCGVWGLAPDRSTLLLAKGGATVARAGGTLVFSKTSVDELRAVLAAYRVVKNGSWPQLHAAMDRRMDRWSAAGETELAAELEGYLKEAADS